jgi:arabinogalactan endo-1,4-beta-galactosidase
MKPVMMWICLLAAGVQSAGFLGGGDISMLTEVEQAGVMFKDEGQAKELIKLMQDNGCTCFRLRLFVNPNGRGGVVQDFLHDCTGQTHQAAGAVLMLDLHYSDTWADPSIKSSPPYGKTCRMRTWPGPSKVIPPRPSGNFKKQDALPELVQVGNEIHTGISLA